MVNSILQDASVSTHDMSDAIHKQAMDYLAIQLEIRDRKEITKVLCHSVPDHFTTAVRLIVSAYEPVIRQAHNAINLSGTVADMEYFLGDMIKLSRIQPPGKDGKSVNPKVGDFIQLLRKHQFSFHRFLHQACKNGQELTGWYVEWAHKATVHFKRDADGGKTACSTGAGNLSRPLNELFSELPKETQDKIIPVLDAQIIYLDEMHAASKARLEAVLSSSPSQNPTITRILTGASSRPSSRVPSRSSSPAATDRTSRRDNAPGPSPLNPDSEVNNDQATAAKSTSTPPSIDSDPGPGAYLARWQDLLDSTLITPQTLKGPLATASSKSVVQKSAIDVDGNPMAEFSEGAASGMARVKNTADGTHKHEKPDVRVVVDALGEKFRIVLSERSVSW